MGFGIATVRVKGVSPLLMHNPVGLMKPADDTPTRGGKKIPLPEDEAFKGLYRLPDGRLYVPADAFREASLIAAADMRDPSRKGRTTMTRRFGAAVFLSDEYFPLHRAGTNGDLGDSLTDSADDWEVHLKRVVVQKAGVMRSRALVRNWTCDVQFEYDDELIDANLIAAIVGLAGKFPGVLDYRPGKRGPYGRFEVVHVE